MSLELVKLNGLSVKADQDFLILEDEDGINDMLAQSLELMGFTGKIYQTYKIEEAQTILKTKPIDYILSDWNLPDGQGIALLRAVRSTERFVSTPFIMITGKSDVDSMMESSKLGVSEYLVKPFDYDDFERKLVEGWKYHLVKEEDFKI
ncbi:MAG: DNA-binding response OmpR family regulator [Bacteriovoracaceae bacterium]|jgi:two-component system sensor histidine kinase/response regulator